MRNELVPEKPKASDSSQHDHTGMKAREKNMDDMGGIKMDGINDNSATMDNIKMAKEKIGPVKTLTNNSPQRTVRYDLYIADTMGNFSGKRKRTIAVNGQIPMPTFTEGDTAEIFVHNNLKEETSLHWHGLFLPNKMDGVPNLTQMPIKPGNTYLYKFPIIQHGMKPREVDRSLHSATDWFAIKREVHKVMARQ